MRTRTVVTALLALALPALVVVPLALAASGDAPPPKPGAAGPKKPDANNQVALSEFMSTCLQGNAKFLSRDFPGSIDTYRKAIQLAPKNPLGHYLLGEAQLATGNMAEAEASWKQADLLAPAAANPVLRARILFVQADLKEQQKKWDEAKALWQAYADLAAKLVGDGGSPSPEAGVHPASAASRLQAIEASMKLDKDYEVVRQRIKDTADGGVFTLIDASK